MRQISPKNQDFELLTKYLLYIGGIREYSKSTVKEYRYDLINFFKYLISVKNPLKIEKLEDIDRNFVKKVSQSDIENYLLYLKTTKSAAPATRARKLYTIKSFFNFLVIHEKLIILSPAQNIKSVKMPFKLPAYLTVEQCKKILSIPDKCQTYSERNVCIITFFLNLALRISELINIKLDDISDNFILIHGKENRERRLYLNKACRNALEKYLECRKDMFAKTEYKDYLFISRQGNKISGCTVNLMLKQTFSLAGLNTKKFSAHKLRHTAATLLYRSGVDILVLQKILGHKSLSTTEIYTHIENDSVKSALQKNPLSKES